MQVSELFPQRSFLCIGTGVAGSLFVMGKSSHIRYADGVPVVVPTMRFYHFFRSAGFDRPIRRDHVMVAATHSAEGTVIVLDVRHPKCTARLVGGTVHNNKSNGTHRFKVGWRPLLRSLQSVPIQGF